MSDDLGVVWMTYDEAAKALGIKRASVQRRAAARKWPRRTGNDRKVQVGIPESVIPEATPEGTSEATSDGPPDKITELSARLAAAEATIKGMHDRIDDRDKQLDEMRADRAKLLDMMTQLTQPKPSLWARISGSRK